MFIQGFYNAGTNSTVNDTVTVIMRQSNAPYNAVDSSKAVISNNGTGSFSFSNAQNGVYYYIELKHRNSIETWSNATQRFMSNYLAYNFTTSGTQAFGGNMIQVDNSPLRFAIYGGDVSQDGIVDATDAGEIDNDANNFLTGYVNTDLTGDEVVDASDAAICDNNASNFVTKVTP